MYYFKKEKKHVKKKLEKNWNVNINHRLYFQCDGKTNSQAFTKQRNALFSGIHV